MFASVRRTFAPIAPIVVAAALLLAFFGGAQQPAHAGVVLSGVSINHRETMLPKPTPTSTTFRARVAKQLQNHNYGVRRIQVILNAHYGPGIADMGWTGCRGYTFFIGPNSHGVWGLLLRNGKVLVWAPRIWIDQRRLCSERLR